jgi:hypothetical protein
MNMPKFTADVSLYRTTGNYTPVARWTGPATGRDVTPAISCSSRDGLTDCFCGNGTCKRTLHDCYCMPAFEDGGMFLTG